jgi:hypothetical protein
MNEEESEKTVARAQSLGFDLVVFSMNCAILMLSIKWGFCTYISSLCPRFDTILVLAYSLISYF